MKIEEQFNLIAKEYDAGRKKFIPCFDEYYLGATDFIASNIDVPNKILDLGAGTGLLDMYWYKYFPNSEYLLVDIAEDMLNIAKERFKKVENIKYQVCDYNSSFDFYGFDVVMSALSIHHLDDVRKQILFKNIYEQLSDGKVFVNYDQFCADTQSLSKWYDDYWIRILENSNLSTLELERWKERRKLDKECSVNQEITMLQTIGFKNVQCIYSNQKFAVILAIK